MATTFRITNISYKRRCAIIVQMKSAQSDGKRIFIVTVSNITKAEVSRRLCIVIVSFVIEASNHAIDSMCSIASPPQDDSKVMNSLSKNT